MSSPLLRSEAERESRGPHGGQREAEMGSGPHARARPRLPCLDAFRGGGWTWAKAAGQWLRGRRGAPPVTRQPPGTHAHAALQEGP